ncbi:hypothetical protein VTO73DRAFT_10209 [Trametes versicolor]
MKCVDIDVSSKISMRQIPQGGHLHAHLDLDLDLKLPADTLLRLPLRDERPAICVLRSAKCFSARILSASQRQTDCDFSRAVRQSTCQALERFFGPLFKQLLISSHSLTSVTSTRSSRRCIRRPVLVASDKNILATLCDAVQDGSRGRLRL